MKFSSSRPEIVLPAATETVDVTDIAPLIAAAVYPGLLASGRLAIESKPLPQDDAERTANVQLYTLERQYQREVRVATENGIRGLPTGLVARSKQTRALLTAGSDITDAYVPVEELRQYVDRTYAIDVRVAPAAEHLDAVPERPATVPVPRQWAQEERILQLLASRNYDALKLPAASPGVSGVKSEIRMLALQEPSLFSRSSFDKAWERLRADGRIANTK